MVIECDVLGKAMVSEAHGEQAGLEDRLGLKNRVGLVMVPGHSWFHVVQGKRRAALVIASRG